MPVGITTSVGRIEADGAEEADEMPELNADFNECDRPALLQRVRAACQAELEWPETLEHVLALAGEELHFSICAFWRRTPDRSAMTCQWIWCAPNEDGDLDEFVLFTKNIAFPLGFGLPGRVWKSRQLIVLTQIDKERTFIRADVAQAALLKSAIGAPVIRNGAVIGMLECFNRAPVAVSDHTISCIEGIAAELARACP